VRIFRIAGAPRSGGVGARRPQRSALAEHPSGELWVVNHLSDSVSIVDVSVRNAAQRRSHLLVGDEPRDIVFAGPEVRGGSSPPRTAARHGRDPQLATPGRGACRCLGFDASNPGASLGGTPLTVITLFARHTGALRHTG